MTSHVLRVKPPAVEATPDLGLHEKGLLSRPVFYMSAYFESRRDDYIEMLRQIDNSTSSWMRWIAFFLDAIETQANANTQKARDIMGLYARLKERVQRATRSQYAVLLLDQFFQRPVFVGKQINLGPRGPSQVTISTMLRHLKEEGALRVLSEGGGRRAQILSLWELVELCEA